MKIREIQAKSILSKSGVYDWTINPYIGCEHSCFYCYARFMKKFTGHKERWGEFIDVKINAPELLEKEVKTKKKGRVWISGVCDPYQPIEKKYKLTRKCLEVLQKNNWPVVIQTKSPLVLRDLKLLKKFKNIEVGFTIPTADEKIKNVFEPRTPSIKQRIKALEKLHKEGIRTYAMIAPLLPEAKDLVVKLRNKIDYAIIDRMNYHYADWVYREHKLEEMRKDDFFIKKTAELIKMFKKEKIPCQVVF